MSESTINRRKAIKQASLVLGYSISGPALAGVLNGCSPDKSLDWQPQFFTESEAFLVEAASERILPAGATPGAKDAKVVKFIDQMVAEYYLPEDQEIPQNHHAEVDNTTLVFRWVALEEFMFSFD